ncbi:MAG: DUF1080 domain-containing protein [Lentimonas sp.]
MNKPNIFVYFADDISARELPIYGSTVWSDDLKGGDSTDPALRASTPVLDDANHIRGTWPISCAGALYDVYGRSDDSCVKPHGEWNTGRIIAKGNRLQHFLNGVKVVDVEVGSDDWQERFNKSKNAKDPEKTNWDFGLQEGRICLQDHGGEVWYRNMKIRKI